LRRHRRRCRAGAVAVVIIVVVTLRPSGTKWGGDGCGRTGCGAGRGLPIASGRRPDPSAARRGSCPSVALLLLPVGGRRDGEAECRAVPRRRAAVSCHRISPSLVSRPWSAL
jgi:hypothetical protein